jgi:ABC-type branched-subunit amino acid transport system substrate-binding protein
MAASAVLVISGAQAQTPTGPIKIGLVQAQTGALADSFGIPSSEGAILAMEEINAKGGIGGRKLEVVSRDDRTSIQPTVIAFQELSQDPDLIAIIGPTTSGAGMAVRQIINDNKLPELSIAYGTALTQSNFKYYYRVGPSLETGNQALLNAIQKHRGDGQKLATLALSAAGRRRARCGCRAPSAAGSPHTAACRRAHPPPGAARSHLTRSTAPS